MGLPDKPLPQETSAALYTPWIEIINRHESGSVLNISRRHQLYRINQFMVDKDLHNQTGLTRHQLISLDLMSLPIEDTEDLKNHILSLNVQQPVALFIIGADILLEEKKHLLGYLDQLPHLYPAVSLLFFFRTNICLREMRTKLSLYGALYQNITFVSYYSVSAMKHYIDYVQKKLSVTLTEQQKKQIIDLCAGDIWLVKEAVRLCGKGLDTWETADSIRYRLKILWEEFLPVEQHVLKKIVKNESHFTPDESEALDYLLRFHFLGKTTSGYRINVKLMQKFIHVLLSRETVIELRDGKHILINNVVVDGMFSRRDHRTLVYLLQANKQVARAELAQVIWREEPYTDWALDMLISRLRKKCQSLGLGRSFIRTIRNQGFIVETAV